MSNNFLSALHLTCLFFPNHLLSPVDIISAIEFDKSGEHLATGDRGGRVVLFERTDGKDVSSSYLCDSPFHLSKHMV